MNQFCDISGIFPRCKCKAGYGPGTLGACSDKLCPDNCNGNGKCIDGECDCNDFYRY